ncbi:hypothetical protein PR202_gb29770 [Eleusine coracana subsp. coracana]|uniref:Aquaporin NIP1-1 n=1 Tax=Eleusine coracana subsp. coracana TaxID=191504 RepID=A0AAV5G1C7_ELECO|nr:hypothetical protein PR202_gb29770 [Eleusine coracana subsp. coracana]
MAGGGGESGAHDQRAMEEGRKEEYPDQGCAMTSVPFVQKILAEIFGTYFLIFAGCGAVTINASKNGQITFPGVAIVWGLVVMVMVYAVGHISGAHFNPAVTFAFATCGRFPWRQVPAYALAQVLGATLASGTLRSCSATPTSTSPGRCPPAPSAVRSSSRSHHLLTSCGHLRRGQQTTEPPVSGASMNPARSIGPALISGRVQGDLGVHRDPSSAPSQGRGLQPDPVHHKPLPRSPRVAPSSRA